MRKSALIGTMVAALALASTAAEPASFAQARGASGAPSAADMKKAQSLFKKGEDLYKIRRFPEALDFFKQSYATVPSPNSHLYIARCMGQMSDQRAAYLEFQKVFEEAEARAASEPKYAPTRDSARVERDEIGSKLALVTVNVAHADASTQIHLGNDDVPQANWGKPVPVNPGAIDVTIETAGKPPQKQSLQLSPGDKRDLSIDAAPIGAAPVEAPVAVETSHSKVNPLRIGSFVAGGIGVVGLVLFAVEGSSSKSKFNDLTTKCGNNPCPPALQSEVSSGKSAEAIANVGLIVGVVGVATGVTLFVLSTRKKSDPPATGGETHFVVGPAYSGLSGTF